MATQRCLTCTTCGAMSQFDAVFVRHLPFMLRNGSLVLEPTETPANLDAYRAGLHRRCPRRKPGQLGIPCNVVECDPLDPSDQPPEAA